MTTVCARPSNLGQRANTKSTCLPHSRANQLATQPCIMTLIQTQTETGQHCQAQQEPTAMDSETLLQSKPLEHVPADLGSWTTKHEPAQN